MSVVLVFNHKQLTAWRGTTLYECLLDGGIKLPASCRGCGRCSECAIRIEAGAELLSPRTQAEQGLEPGIRLACQAVLEADQGSIICSAREGGSQRIESFGSGMPEAGFRLDPAVEIRNGRVWMAEKMLGPYRTGIYGVALDIGTSTVVMRIVNLENGEVEGTTSFLNPQSCVGSDVMSRISFAVAGGTDELQRYLVEQVNRVIGESAIPAENIYEMVIAGNPAMRDLFLGIDVSGLGQAPFRSRLEVAKEQGRRDSTSIYLPPSALGIRINPGGRIYGLPLPGCHVGGDIAAGILFSGLAWDGDKSVFLDLGTNSEIVVKSGNQITVASCPAGPAFEGGRIKFGMPGLPGAVEAVRIMPDRSILMQTIGEVKPSGFCGSGLISFLGELLKCGMIDIRGHFKDKGETVPRKDAAIRDGFNQVDAYDWKGCFSSFWTWESPIHEPRRLRLGGENGIYIDEEDISRVIQAKAAVTSGLRIILRSCGLEKDDLEVFYLAGAFGRYLNLGAAFRIGLLPELEAEKFRRLGNSSIEGATMALLSCRSRNRLEKAMESIMHLELETEPDYFELYTDGCLLERM